MKRTIATGYKAWLEEPERSASTQVDFGGWWEMDGMRWRVAWIQDTGELYAAEYKSDRYFVIGHFDTKKEVNQTMHQWFEGSDLGALVRRLKT